MKPRMVVALALLLLVGCDDSKAPLSNPEDAKPDARLAGVWRFRGEDGQVSYLHIGRASEELPAAVMRVVSVTHTEGKVEPPYESLMFPESLDGNTYLNVIGGKEEQVKLLEKKDWKAVESYFICKYKVDGDTLLIWFMDRDAKKRAIEAGKIKGVIEKKKFITTIKFTDTTENLARFVAQESDSLFSNKPLRLERLEAGTQTAVVNEMNAEGEKKAVDAAEAWLALVDQGKYAKSWVAAASYLKNAATKDAFATSLTAVRKPLGKVKSRELKSKVYRTSLPGAPDGQYVVIQFQTAFENKDAAIETVTPMLDKDKTWRVSGYYIK